MTSEQFLLWRVGKNSENPIWSQEYVARWLGTTARSVKRWESGELPVPPWVVHRVYEFELMSQAICKLTRRPYYEPEWTP